MITKILRKYKGSHDWWYPGIDNPYKVDDLKNASGELENNIQE